MPCLTQSTALFLFYSFVLRSIYCTSSLQRCYAIPMSSTSIPMSSTVSFLFYIFVLTAVPFFSCFYEYAIPMSSTVFFCFIFYIIYCTFFVFLCHPCVIHCWTFFVLCLNFVYCTFSFPFVSMWCNNCIFFRYIILLWFTVPFFLSCSLCHPLLYIFFFGIFLSVVLWSSTCSIFLPHPYAVFYTIFVPRPHVNPLLYIFSFTCVSYVSSTVSVRRAHVSVVSG